MRRDQNFWKLISSSEIHKLLLKISKLKGCASLECWIKPCLRHLHWSAVSTPSGNGEVIWAKFYSFLFHVQNVHENLPNPIFNKCAHSLEIPPKKWLQKGTLNNNQLFLKLKSNTVMLPKFEKKNKQRTM